MFPVWLSHQARQEDSDRLQVINSSVMKTWTPVFLPFILFILSVFIFIVSPGLAEWAVSDSFKYMPYVLLGAGFILGGVFTQSRVSFLCLLFACITILADYSFFVKHDIERGKAIIFLSTIYVPPLTAVLYRLSERGFWTAHTGFRALMVLSAVFVVFLLPLIPELNNGISHAESVLFRPLSDFIRIPLIGILAFLVSLPFLVIRKQHESPFLGRLLALAVLFMFGALNHPVVREHSRYGEAMLLIFMSGSAVTLIWAVLESSWRSANIDELTELPGRRALKHHLARLDASYSLAVLDIDHFKNINDRYGHDTGDQVLKFIAVHLGNNIVGTAYRYGGEEFVIVGERGNMDETVEGLEMLRKAISGRKFWLRSKDRPRKKPEKASSADNHAHRDSITVTVSIGVAEKSGRHSSPHEVLDAADKALYKAKKEGRDRTKVAQ